jgi:hypothetical protein
VCVCVCQPDSLVPAAPASPAPGQVVRRGVSGRLHVPVCELLCFRAFVRAYVCLC